MTRRGRPPHPDVLTPAEWNVLDGVRSGLTNAEIAERLGISVNTVRYHVSNMLTKVGVTDRQALAAWEGVPVSGVRFTRGGLIALTRFLGLAAALVAAAALAWFALDRLAGVTSEVPAGLPEATATPSEPTPVPTTEPSLAREVPFASDEEHWARAIVADGGTGLQSPLTVIRPDGTIVFAASVATSERPTVDVGGGPLPLAGLHDIVLAALAPDGRHLWSKVLGGPGDDYPADLALASDGGFVITGSFEDGMDFGAGTIRSSEAATGERHSLDAFVARFSPSGQPEWVKTFGTGYADWGGSVGLLPGGDLVVTLSSNAARIEVGDTVVELSSRQTNVVARLSLEGEVRWARSFPGTWYVGPMRVDPRSGDLVAVTWGTVQLENGDDRRSADGLVRLTADGDERWRVTFSSATGSRFADLEIDDDGSIVLGGMFEVPVDFGGGVIDPRGGDDGYLARFSADGEHLWSKSVNRTRDYLEALAIGNDGDLWIAGGSLIERLSPEGEREAELDLVTPMDTRGLPGSEVGNIGGNRIDRMSTLIVDSPGLGNGEILIGGRFYDRAVFPFGGRIRSTSWLPNFIARIEAP